MIVYRLKRIRRQGLQREVVIWKAAWVSGVEIVGDFQGAKILRGIRRLIQEASRLKKLSPVIFGRNGRLSLYTPEHLSNKVKYEVPLTLTHSCSNSGAYLAAQPCPEFLATWRALGCSIWIILQSVSYSTQSTNSVARNIDTSNAFHYSNSLCASPLR